MMFVQTRRWNRGFGPMVVVMGIVVVEIMVFLLPSLDSRLTMAALGGLVMAFFGIICLLRLEWGLVALLVLGVSLTKFPVYTQDFAGLSLSEILVPFLFAVYLLQVFTRRQSPPADSSTHRPLVLLSALAVASLAYGNIFWDQSVPTGHRYLIVQATGVVLVILPAATYFLFANCFDIRRNLRWLLVLFVVLPSLASAAVIASFLSSFNELMRYAAYFGWRGVLDTTPIWASPLASWSNLGYLAAPLAFSASVYTTRLKTRLAMWAFLVPVVLATLASLKLGGLIATFSGLAVVAWVRSKRLFAVLLVVFAVLMVGQTLATEGSTLAALISNAEKKGSFDRAGIFTDGLNIWLTNPLLGVGPGNYYSYSYVYTSFERVIAGSSRAAGKEENPYGNAHNGYIQLVAELGIVGLGLFLWFLTGAMRGAFQAVRGASTTLEKAFAVGALGALVGVLVDMFTMQGVYFSVTSMGFVTFVPGMYMWATMGMLTALSRRN